MSKTELNEDIKSIIGESMYASSELYENELYRIERRIDDIKAWGFNEPHLYDDYIDKILRYGAATPRSQKVLHELVKNGKISKEEAMHLDSSIQPEEMPYPEGENDMARQRFNVTLPTGENVWLTGKTVSDAFVTGLKKYGAPAEAPIAKDCPTFTTYAEKWFKLYHVPKVKPNVSSNTKIYLHKHYEPFFGERRLDEIKMSDIQEFFNTKEKLGKSTCDKLRIYLGQIFSTAVEDGMLEKSPVVTRRLNYSKRVVERKALTQEEAGDILRHVSQLAEADRLLIVIPLLTGARREETLGLRWEDIDYVNGLVHIERAVTFTNNQPVIGEPKSKAGYRSIPLAKELQEFLAPYKKDIGFIVGDGIKPITESTYKRAWQRIKKTIDLHGATAHSFRHTYITLASTNLDVKTLQTIAGHADIQTTMNRYAHGREDIIKAAGQKLTGMYSAAAN